MVRDSPLAIVAAMKWVGSIGIFSIHNANSYNKSKKVTSHNTFPVELWKCSKRRKFRKFFFDKLYRALFFQRILGGSR